MKTKTSLTLLAGMILTSGAFTATAATRYVNLNNPVPAPPYLDWPTAATNIQDAVDVAIAGDEILVTNGVYQTGAQAVYGMSNRVAVTKAVVVRSVNGPGVTSIAGYQVPGTTNGAAAVRCAYLTNGAVLSGFTLTNGATQSSGDTGKQQSGGGVWCESVSAQVTNCVLLANSAFGWGGGAFQGTLNNCTLKGNFAASGGGGAHSGTLNNCTLTGNSAWSRGGGAYNGTLNNCTLTGNSASYSGGGAIGGTLINCIVYYNTARDGNNYFGGSLNFCCTTPLPASGTNNLVADPQLASASHLSASSPCRGAGSAAYATGQDMDGEPWANPPSIGCDEYWSGAVTGALSAAIVADYTNVAVGFNVNFRAELAERLSASVWDFGDGTVVSNRPYTTHAWAAAGDFPVVLQAYNESFPAGVSATVTVHVETQPVHHVALTSPTPAAPYSSWETAATNIQDAVDVATLPGALLLVSNGVYQVGAREVHGMSNRVAVTKALFLRSVNGPGVTSIAGYQVPGTTNGAAAVRCVYLTNGAVLSGFTLTNGATQPSGDYNKQQSGGGVWCESASAQVTNCMLIANAAYDYGGGAYLGTLNNCTLTRNSATFGGGASYGTLNNCIMTGNSASDYHGGGAYYGTLNNCTLAGNSAWIGGGASYGALNNCIMTGNSASYGGGASYGTLNNCTLAGNSAKYGGGVYDGRLNNCTLTGNAASTNGGAAYSGTLNNCTLTDNSAKYGGGAYQGTLHNCTLIGNAASTYGGGAYYGTLNNCTLTGNSASTNGGGAYGSTLNNCIAYYNTARNGNNYYYGSLAFCCTTPLPASGTSNLVADPQLASASHLSASSPCRGAGSAAFATGLDIDGEPWVNPPSIGCDEYWSGSVTGALSAGILADYIYVAVGSNVNLQAIIAGRVSASAWDFGDGTVESNRPYAAHAWNAVGDYPVVLRAFNETFPAGVAAMQTIHVVSPSVHYVALDSSAPAAPYISWATAATNIQQAVDVAADGDQIWVTNGVYGTGGRVVSGAMTNRVAVTKAVTVRSVNGPEGTIIRGYQVPGTTTGNSAVRCVWLTNGAALVGFTLTNGATRSAASLYSDQCGGGVLGASLGCVVSNCLLAGNSAYQYGGGASSNTLVNCTLTGNSANYGGGAFSGTLNNCTLTGNSAGYGGGAAYGTLDNCTLTGNLAYFYGGGAFNGILNNCTLTGNWASSYGGGARNGTLNNCTLTGNSAQYGGGASSGTLNNCTLTGNSAERGGGASSNTLNNCTLAGNSASFYGGGAYYGTLNNCIAYYNTARTGNNYYGGDLNFCCTTPLPASGTSNLVAEPQLASASHLSASSPCRGAGNAAFATGPDIDGEPWANPPSIGCDEYWSGSVTGTLSAAIVADYALVAVGSNVNLQAIIAGRVSASAWDFGGGTVVSNQPYTSHAWDAAGDYPVLLRAYNESFPAGVLGTLVIHVVTNPVHYVALDSSTPTAPYWSWATAATNIQDAVDVAAPGNAILVTNGVYQVGARAVYYWSSNRVAVTKAVVVRSVNGPSVTSIEGFQVPGTTNGLAAVRCVYLTNGAVLSGFTLTNGATQNFGYSPQQLATGGGVWCESDSALVTNCVFLANSAAWGGGAYRGTLHNCTLIGNAASSGGGGAYYGTLNNCTLAGNSASTNGGGAHYSTLSNCILTGNSASFGGGAYEGTLSNCTLTRNSASSGGGAFYGTLNNCTLASNSASYFGGGAYSCTLNNCILYYNPVGGNYDGSRLNYCCTTPLPTGPGNFTNVPLFVDTNGWANLRLQAGSPGINAGLNVYAPGATDLDGNPRISGGTVDVGAYEFQSPASRISYAWLQSFGLPSDGSADDLDSDDDGMNNWQEWVAGTNPTNSASALRLLTPTNTLSGLLVSWSSVTDRRYFLERGTNLGSVPMLSLWQSNLPGQADVTSVTDTNAPGSGASYYRVGIQP